MGLNVISNYAANVAHRNLTATDAQASSSLAKLSSGTRVVSAKDDAASLAIGSRISSEVQGLKQASVNAGQAVSMLQIADGAMSRVSDIMTRMKTLAVQAGSDQIGATERGMLDTEYQSLLSEVDRIAQVTNFNGQKLVAGSATQTTGTEINKLTPSLNALDKADGFSKFTADASVGNAAFQVTYNATTKVMTLDNLTAGTSATIDLGDGTNTIAAGETRDVDFAALGVTITLNENFDLSSTTNDIAPTGTFSGPTAGAGVVTAAGINVTAATSGVKSLSTNEVKIGGASADNATLKLGDYQATGVNLSATGAKSVVLSNGTDSITVAFSVGTAFTDAGVASADASFTVGDLTSMAFSVDTTNKTEFSFKMGTGNVENVDTVKFSVDAVSTKALGLTSTSIATKAGADIANDKLSGAIDTLNVSRANIGASQNRLEFAVANLASTIENQEAARSSLLDLDVAAEMTKFTSKQILMQAGVSMLAQANQMPQNLMRLFG